MILPTKHIPEKRALLTVGSQVSGLLAEPRTVSSLWQEFRDRHTSDGPASSVTFDWFVLALDLLFALELLDYSQGTLSLR